MRYIKLLVFILLIYSFFQVQVVFAMTVDELEPDENGEYWIYFNIKGDDIRLTRYSETHSHSADVDIWVNVTDSYNQGFKHFAFSNSGSTLYFLSTTGSNGISPVLPVIVDGEVDGESIHIERDFRFGLGYENLNCVFEYGNPDFLYWTFCSSNSEYINYLPNSSKASSFDGYVQDKPKKTLPAPQVPVFEYEYINGRISGLVCCFRYPVDTVEHFYELVDKGKRAGSSHSSTVDGSAYYKKTPYVYAASDTENEYADMSTYLDYRVTFMIGSNSYTTGWARLGIFGYADTKYNQFQITNSTWWFFDVYNQYDVLVRDWKNNSEIWQCMLRLDKLPDIIKDSGYVSFSDTDSIILTKIEVSAYNVLQRGARSLTSDMVYGQFDCITNTFSGSVLPDSSPEIVAGDDGNITVNVNIDIDTVVPTVPSTSVPTGNTDVVPGVSGDGSSSGGGSGFFDGISGLFDLVLKFLEVVITGLVRLGRLFFSLIGDIIDMCGEFPKLFGFVVDAFPQEFMTLVMIGFAAALILKIFGR